MPRDFFPRRNADVLTWSGNLAAKLASDPGAYHIPVQTAASYVARHEVFVAAQRLAVEPGTRSRPTIAARDAARVTLEAEARQVCGQIRVNPLVTAEQRVQLGLGPGRRKPSRIPRPTTAAQVVVRGVFGHRVMLRIVDPASPTRGAKPRGVAMAVLFTYAGEVPPAARDGWSCAGYLSRLRAVVPFDVSIRPGTKVWLCAAWVNARGEDGPLGPVVSAQIQFDAPVPIAMSRAMKLMQRAA